MTRGTFLMGCMAALALGLSGQALAGKQVLFGGGPAGGTFQLVANAIQDFGPVRELKGLSLSAQASAGSVENLRKVDSGRMHFGVVYSGHLYQARNGTLQDDASQYQKVLAVAYLYGAPAQLVIRQGAGINSVKDLAGKRIAVGNTGSGAIANAEQYFGHLGLWDKIERHAMGYNDAAQAFGNQQLDAFWLFTGIPGSAVTQAAQTNDIDLLDLAREAEESGYFTKYPYFSRVDIPANTYRGVTHPTPSFQDAALWVANPEVPAEAVYQLLSLIYSDAGLAHMAGQLKGVMEMSLANGNQGIVTPLHPGAERFWREKGLIH
jgi:uncharacterized protein